MSPISLIELLEKSESTSSGTGASYYGETCPRRSRLDKEHGRGTSFQAQVGTAFHKLAELYYTEQLRDVALPLNDMADFDTDFVQEALRLFFGYTQFFPANEWIVVTTERLLPENDEQRKKVLEAIGVPFTWRSDQLVRLEESHAGQFLDRRFLPIEPGNWLVDFKTHGQKDSKAELKYSISAQFISNMMAHDALFPEDKLKGLIVVEAVRHKKLTRDSFRTFIVPFPSEVQQEAVRKHFAWKAEYLKSDRPNLEACTDWAICEHYKLGRCNRL